MNSFRPLAIVGVRLIALLGFFGSVWMLIGNLVEFCGELDGIYWEFFVRACLLKPLTGFILACLLWAGSSCLGGWLVRDADRFK